MAAMKQHIENTRRHLGELAAMSSQVERAERQILERAEKLLAGVQGKMDAARAEAMAGDDAARQRYTDLVAERGRLNQVIAQAREVLAGA